MGLQISHSKEHARCLLAQRPRRASVFAAESGENTFLAQRKFLKH